MTPFQSKPLILPRLLRGAGLLLLLGAVVWYVAFQARYLIAGPGLSISPDLPVVQHNRVIELHGMAKNVTALSLNGRSIVIDENGAFTEPVVLENGYTIMSIEARDRYGRTVRIERPLVYVADENAPTLSK